MSWKEKSAVALLAAGLFGAGEANAQTFNTNLLVNASFEDVTGTGVNRPLASGWAGDSLGTYAYADNYTLPGPTGSGLRYWTGNANAVAVTNQTVDLTGFGAAALDSGQLTYGLDAFFSTYLSQGDFGAVRLRFRNAANTQIGSDITVGGQAFVNALGSGAGGLRAWGQSATTGFIPTGTRNALISLVATRVAGNSNDSYIDLANFQVTGRVGAANAPEPGGLLLVALGGLMGLACRRAARRRA